MENSNYLYGNYRFPDNAGGSAAVNVTAELITRSQSIPLYGISEDAPLREKVNTKDYFVIQFGAGDYIIDHSIVMRCNVIIMGEGVDKTKIRFTRQFNETYRENGFCYDWDDAFFCVKGQKGREVTVEISNLTMQVATGTTVNPNPFHLVKLQHARKVLFCNVNSKYTNLKAHNLDMRVCSNIVVKNCKFTAYNNMSEGAIMAIRGNTENVYIQNNSFHKHGNDEMLTFFGCIEDLNDTVQLNGTTRSIVPKENFKRNIVVEGNSFNYEQVNDSALREMGTNLPVQVVNDLSVLFSFYDIDHQESIGPENSQNGDYTDINMEVENVVVRNNHFVAIYAPVRNWISFSFSNFVKHRGIVVDGNEFMQGQCFYNGTTKKVLEYRENITIRDNSRGSEAIVIKNNKLWNFDVSRVSYNNNVSFETRYSFLQFHGGNVLLENNTILDRAKADNYDGMTLLELEEQDVKYSERNFYGKNEGIGMSVIMRGNHVEGLNRLAHVIRVKHPLARVVVENNYIKGGCFVEVRNTERVDLSVKHNELHSSAYQLIYKGSSNMGNLIFDNNTAYNEYKPAGGSTPASQEFFDNYEEDVNGNFLLMPLEINHLQMTNNNFVDFTDEVYNTTLHGITRLSVNCYTIEENNNIEHVNL